MDWLRYLLIPLIVSLHICFVYELLILPATWYWRRWKAGLLLISMGKRSDKRWQLLFSLSCFGFAIFATLYYIRYGFDARPSIGWIWLFFGSYALYSFCLGMSELQVRERGLCFDLEVIRWQRMASYTWLGNNLLLIRLKPRIPLPLIRRRLVHVPSHYKSALEEHLAQLSLPARRLGEPVQED